MKKGANCTMHIPSIILLFFLVFTVTPDFAFATEGKDVMAYNAIDLPQYSNERPEEVAPPADHNVNNRMRKAADTLYILELFKGTGTDSKGKPIYDLDVKPTRQVAITMLVRLLGKEKEALSGNWKHPFTDVDPWANPYVGYAYTKGFTMGVSKTNFGSKDLANANQYLTFVLRALGYNDTAGDFTWNNPTVLSEKIGLTMSEYKDNSAPFLRGDVVIISESLIPFLTGGPGQVTK